MVEPGEFVIVLGLASIGIDDRLPGLLPPVTLDESFEAESDRVGAGRCHSLAHEFVDFS